MKKAVAGNSNPLLQELVSVAQVDSEANVASACILQVNNQFFLLLELVSEENGEEIVEVVALRITATQAQGLLAAGIPRCEILLTFPEEGEGVTVDFICVLIISGMAFLVFRVVENGTDRLVLVQANICEIIG